MGLSFGSLNVYFGLAWGIFEVFLRLWDSLGAILSLSGSLLGHSGAHVLFCPVSAVLLGQIVPIQSPILGCISGLFEAILTLWGSLGAILRLSRGLLGPSWGILGLMSSFALSLPLFWAESCPSGRRPLGGSLGCLLWGTISGPRSGPPRGPILGPFWGPEGASERPGWHKGSLTRAPGSPLVSKRATWQNHRK